MSRAPSQDPDAVWLPRELGLPPGELEAGAEAGRAVAAEMGEGRARLWHCRAVEPVSGDVYRLEVAGELPADWTWEGSRAFRSDWHQARERELGMPQAALWSGEIVELDPVGGELYVAVEDERAPPVPGALSVRPFQFLECLDRLWNDPERAALAPVLAAQLRAARGGVHPRRDAAAAGLPALRGLWDHSWSVLWGPPGTGKTHTIGEQVAACLADPAERILVISTSNRATDGAALAILRALRRHGGADPGREAVVVRAGKGVRYRDFAAARALHLLPRVQERLRRRIDALREQHELADRAEDRVELASQLRLLWRQLDAGVTDLALDPARRVVVTTAYQGLVLAASDRLFARLRDGFAPFSTVILDEAGLLSRAAVAALALLAAHRVVLVGDPRQLSPVSKISRVLPSAQATWLAESGLGHLASPRQCGQAVQLLDIQWRMHPEIARAVSHYAYENQLRTAPGVGRPEPPARRLAGQPRALWYVVDDDPGASDLAAVRACRGPGGRSWQRPITLAILDRLLRSHPELAAGPGLFISPFTAQARAVAGWLARRGLAGWSASTIHKQQGAEATCVVIDTVAAGTGWSPAEWRRLINVALSRARELVLLLCSRDEMADPGLAPLAEVLAPRVLEAGPPARWRKPAAAVRRPPAGTAGPARPGSLGAQLEERRAQRPILTAEQQRLCQLRLDGKPRLVRGVAGSGKTLVLASWVARLLRRSDAPQRVIGVVYGNRALRGLLAHSLEQAWQRDLISGAFPWPRVALVHIKDLLQELLAEVGAAWPEDSLDYEKVAADFLAKHGAGLVPRFDALFIDEAQDMGHEVMRLLFALTRPHGAGGSRDVNIFHDNAQNLYGRTVPRWSELGIDLRGRSTVMKESFRNTRPVAEFALNVLARLRDLSRDPDHRELLRRRLVTVQQCHGRPLLRVHFQQSGGPAPQLALLADRDEELRALARTAHHLVAVEAVAPRDIRVVLQGRDQRGPLAETATELLRRALGRLGVRVELLRSRPPSQREDTLVVTTPHSFKGYEAEVVLVPCADQFAAAQLVRAESLYVALTRARSLLWVSALARPASSGGAAVVAALASVRADLAAAAGPGPIAEPVALASPP
jgi:superfamily I DNA/RNA helicase